MLPIAELISFKLFGRYKEAKCPSPLRQFHPLDIRSSRIDMLPTICVFSRFNLPPESALSRIKAHKNLMSVSFIYPVTVKSFTVI